MGRKNCAMSASAESLTLYASTRIDGSVQYSSWERLTIVRTFSRRMKSASCASSTRPMNRNGRILLGGSTSRPTCSSGVFSFVTGLRGVDPSFTVSDDDGGAKKSKYVPPLSVAVVTLEGPLLANGGGGGTAFDIALVKDKCEWIADIKRNRTLANQDYSSEGSKVPEFNISRRLSAVKMSAEPVKGPALALTVLTSMPRSTSSESPSTDVSPNIG